MTKAERKQLFKLACVADLFINTIDETHNLKQDKGYTSSPFLNDLKNLTKDLTANLEKMTDIAYMENKSNTTIQIISKQFDTIIRKNIE